MSTCPTPCDADCTERCHEVHEVRYRRAHQPMVCPGWGETRRTSAVAHRDVCPSQMPLTIEAFRVDTREVVWREVVAEPRTVAVPALAKLHGPVGIRVTDALGVVNEHVP